MNPFDASQHMRDEAGKPVCFINDPLDEQYVAFPGNSAPEGMLPPEEFEVRRALAEMKIFTERFAEFGFLKKIFDKTTYQQAKQVAIEKQETLRRLVNSSPEHKAAIRRIVSAMPKGNGGREALASYIA